jgi:hypothetical protein
MVEFLDFFLHYFNKISSLPVLGSWIFFHTLALKIWRLFHWIWRREWDLCCLCVSLSFFFFNSGGRRTRTRDEVQILEH